MDASTETLNQASTDTSGFGSAGASLLSLEQTLELIELMIPYVSIASQGGDTAVILADIASHVIDAPVLPDLLQLLGKDPTQEGLLAAAFLIDGLQEQRVIELLRLGDEAGLTNANAG
jgi:hypothetical protein